jgi:amino acid transporter
VNAVKGVELPINILVIVAIAVIVLLGLVALYFIGFNPFSVTTALDAAKNTGCRTYMNQYPTPCGNWTTFNVTWQGNDSVPFNEFMVDEYGCTSDENCARRACGCPGA